MDARAALPGVLDACATFAPDVVVYEPSELAGRLAAAHHRIPTVAVSITQFAVEQRRRTGDGRGAAPPERRAPDRTPQRHPALHADAVRARGPGHARPARGHAPLPRAGRSPARAAAGLVERVERSAGLRHLRLGRGPARGHLPGALQPRDRPARAAPRAGARHDRPRPRPTHPRRAAGQRPRRALGAATHGAAARAGGRRPRRLRHAARRHRGGPPAGRHPAVRRPARQRPAHRRARRRHRAPAGHERPRRPPSPPCSPTRPTRPKPRRSRPRSGRCRTSTTPRH